MGRAEAEQVVKHLERAKEAALPLKDKELTKKISEANDYLTKKLDKNNQ